MPQLPTSLSPALCRFFFRHTGSQLRPVLTDYWLIWLTTSFVAPEFSSSSPTVTCCSIVYLRPRSSVVSFFGSGQRRIIIILFSIGRSLVAMSEVFSYPKYFIFSILPIVYYHEYYYSFSFAFSFLLPFPPSLSRFANFFRDHSSRLGF
jgi:hypothetical protein